MNSLLITEQMELEKIKSMDHSKMLAIQNQQLDQRSDYNEKYRELFGKILEAYLEIPHKLKPIFDKNKKFEQTMNKIFTADSTLIYDLTADVIEKYKEKHDEALAEINELETKQNE